jgi:hypothetical protein
LWFYFPPLQRLSYLIWWNLDPSHSTFCGARSDQLLMHSVLYSYTYVSY